MNPLLTVLLAVAAKPYHAVSKPTIQVWARFKSRNLLGRMVQWARASSLRLASERGELTVGALPETSEELAEFLADDENPIQRRPAPPAEPPRLLRDQAAQPAVGENRPHAKDSRDIEKRPHIGFFGRL